MIEFIPTMLLAVLAGYFAYLLHVERVSKDHDISSLNTSHTTMIKDLMSLHAEDREKLLDRLMSRSLDDYKINQVEPEKVVEPEEEVEIDIEDAREEMGAAE